MVTLWCYVSAFSQVVVFAIIHFSVLRCSSYTAFCVCQQNLLCLNLDVLCPLSWAPKIRGYNRIHQASYVSLLIATWIIKHMWIRVQNCVCQDVKPHITLLLNTIRFITWIINYTGIKVFVQKSVVQDFQPHLIFMLNSFRCQIYTPIRSCVS